MEEKKRAFTRWQEHRADSEKWKEYVDLCKEVRRAVKGDKDKCLDRVMQDMEEDMRHNRQGRFLRNEAADG